jgi:hypothetical protein
MTAPCSMAKIWVSKSRCPKSRCHASVWRGTKDLRGRVNRQGPRDPHRDALILMCGWCALRKQGATKTNEVVEA